MGITLAEGKRIFMYEAFIVIIAAGIIGLIIGIVVACLITAQFYMFLELPFVFNVRQLYFYFLVPRLADTHAGLDSAGHNLLRSRYPDFISQ
jgi:ABC-type lipoprotein release transport system permease subunit